MTIRFESIPVWPHASTPDASRRSPWAFKAGWADTIHKLRYELERVGADDVVIRSGHTERDVRNDGLLRADARRPPHPGVEVAFTIPPRETGETRRGRRIIAEHGSVRAALHATHPDHGGDPLDFQSVRQVADPSPVRRVFPCDTYERWEHNVRAIALTLESLRAVDRYGAAAGRQYEGFAQLTAGTATT